MGNVPSAFNIFYANQRIKDGVHSSFGYGAGFVYSSIRLFVYSRFICVYLRSSADYSRFSPLVAFQVQPIEFFLCEFQVESFDIGPALIGMEHADE